MQSKVLLAGEGLKCSICSGNHWNLQCPFIFKDLNERKPKLGGLKVANKTDLSPEKSKTDDDPVIIRISNLSKNTDEIDVEDLVKPFGPGSKVLFAKDKVTGLCKGFAYVHFKKHCDAVKSIAALNGMGFDHLTLSVDWAKQQGEGLKCSICDGDHWILQCPYKDLNERKPKLGGLKVANKTDLGPKKSKTDDDPVIIRISNLSKTTNEIDVEDLVKPFGPVSKVRLPKDKIRGECKGFAYVHFKNHCDAVKSIADLDGISFDHLNLKVDWAKHQG